MPSRDCDWMSLAMTSCSRRQALATVVGALGLGLAGGGCSSNRQQKQVAQGLPSRHIVRSHQVQLRADGPIPGEEEVLAELGRVRERLQEEFGVMPGERDVVVYLFSDRDRYARYMAERHPDLPARRAFFIGTPKELAVYAHWGEHVLVDLRHEYTHGLLHAAVGPVPLWLDEGIAEYMEVGEQDPSRLNPEHVGRLNQAAVHGWRPNLASLERLEQVDEMQREHYQEAWAWVHYLQHEAHGGREVISQYLNELRRRQQPALISQRLGQSLPQTEAQLAQYVSQLRLGSPVPTSFRATSAGQF